jgi:hypothetical protein
MYVQNSILHLIICQGASAYIQCLTGDISGILRTQKQHSPDNVFQLSQTPLGYLGRDHLFNFRILPEGLTECGFCQHKTSGGIVDHNVDPPIRIHRTIDQSVDLITGHEIGDLRDGFAASGFDVVDNTGKFFFGAGCQHQFGAAPRQFECDGPADTSTAAGDDCYFTFEIIFRYLCPFFFFFIPSHSTFDIGRSMFDLPAMP